MKKIMTLLPLTCLLLISCAQQPDPQLLVKNGWHFHSSRMSGIGTHQNIQEQTVLKFYPDGTWQCNSALMGTREGKWAFNKKGNAMLWFSGNEKAEIISVSETALVIRYRKRFSTTTWEWRPE